MFYGKPSALPTDSPVGIQPTSTPTAEPGTATPPQEIVAPAAEVKPDPVKEAQAEQAKAEAEKAKVEESHRQAARKLGKQVQELQAQLAQLAEDNRILKAKADGTYEEPTGPTPEEIQARATFEGRELASQELAIQKYGAEKVMERIYAKDSELSQFLTQQRTEKKTWAERRIAESLQPTIEAWTILEEHTFKEKYGNDPSQWAAKIIADAKPALVEEIKKTLSAPVVGTPAPTVTQARGSGGPEPRQKTIAELFYGKPTTPA
jgi:hypothetical protein